MSEDLPSLTKGRKSGLAAVVLSTVAALGAGSGGLALEARLTRVETQLEQARSEVTDLRATTLETDRRARQSEASGRAMASDLSDIKRDTRETRDRMAALCARMRCQ